MDRQQRISSTVARGAFEGSVTAENAGSFFRAQTAGGGHRRRIYAAFG